MAHSCSQISLWKTNTYLGLSCCTKSPWMHSQATYSSTAPAQLQLLVMYERQSCPHLHRGNMMWVVVAWVPMYLTQSISSHYSHYRDEGKINRDLAPGCIIKITTHLITFSWLTPDSYSWTRRERRRKIKDLRERKGQSTWSIYSIKWEECTHKTQLREERVTDHILIRLTKKENPVFFQTVILLRGDSGSQRRQQMNIVGWMPLLHPCSRS